MSLKDKRTELEKKILNGEIDIRKVFILIKEQDKQAVKELKENEDIINKVKDWMQDFKKENGEYPSYLAIVLKCVELFESKSDEIFGENQ